MSENAPHIRRVVTGHDAAGRATIWRDGPATNHKFPVAGVASTLMWVTDATPADFMGERDEGERILGTAPPAGGTRFCVMEFAPGNAVHGQHRTDSIDYVICVSGEIGMDLDDETVTLRAGDVMIQRGTDHVWVNRGSVPARLAIVLIDGAPKRAGSVGGTANAR
jgi:quercetin dioxygenase-like cupin family protein